MRPTGIYGLATGCPVSSEFHCMWLDTPLGIIDNTTAVLLELSDPKNPATQPIRDRMLRFRLIEAGVLGVPASRAPAAYRIHDHKAADRIIREFDAQQMASHARLCRKLLGT